MPLTELIRLLNSRTPSPFRSRDGTPAFVATGQGVVVHFGGLRLHSEFRPIVATRDGRRVGHAAELRVTGPADQPRLDPADVFERPENDREFVYLDRLVRTLHALNHLAQAERGTLLLKVQPRHVRNVASEHGQVFEELLQRCGLAPCQLTLELEVADAGVRSHFLAAVASYRSRGYGVALSQPGQDRIDFALVAATRPDIVRLDPALLDSASALRVLIGRLHHHGAGALIEGIETRAIRQAASALGIDLLQSRLLHRLSADGQADRPANGMAGTRGMAPARSDASQTGQASPALPNAYGNKKSFVGRHRQAP